jgi:HAMP domain-containing protein
MEAMLVARDGTVIIGPAGLEGTRLALRSAMAAGQGVGVVTEEAWPDGRRYLTVAAPAGAVAGLPGFGWSVIVRQPPEAALGGVRSLALAIGVPMAASAALLLIAGIALARWIGRPLARLAQSATALAEGRLDSPVPEARSTREAALLSAALARLDRGPPDPTLRSGSKA